MLTTLTVQDHCHTKNLQNIRKLKLCIKFDLAYEKISLIGYLGIKYKNCKNNDINQIHKTIMALFRGQRPHYKSKVYVSESFTKM